MIHGNVPLYPLNNFHTNGPHCNQTKSAAPLFMTPSLKFALALALRNGGTGFLAAKFHQQGWQKQEVRNQCA